MNQQAQKELKKFLQDQFNQILEADAENEINDLIKGLDAAEEPGILFEKFLKDIGIIGNQLKLIKKSFEALKFYNEKMQKRKQQQKKNVVPIVDVVPVVDLPIVDVKESIDLFTNEKILLSELLNDKKKIPTNCSQSGLYDVLINGLLLKYPILIPEYEKLPDTKKHPALTQQKLMEKIKELRNKISEENRLSPDIKTIFTNIEFNKNDLFDNLISLKKELLGIDVCDLQRLIEKTKQAQNNIKEKSIVLFIGDTGAGKTTTILGLYGFTMVKKKFKGMDWVAPLQTITDETLKLLHTSPQQKSITRYPLAILPKQKLSNSQQVWFVDTPGFGDSAGVEVDLANGIGTINTIKGSKSVKSIVVISKQSWGTRGAGIKKLAKILGSLFGNYKNVQDSVMFIWNRFPQDELRELNLKIKDLIQHTNPQQKINQNLMSLLEDLAEKTQEFDKIIHYNPLVKDAHKPILAKIKKLKELKHPEQYFDLAFTENTKSRTKQQCLVYQTIIHYHFDSNNIESVSYFLQNYNLLQSLVPMLQIKKQYDDTFEYLENTIKSRFSREADNLCRRMRSFNLSVDDINNFQKQTQEIEKYKVLDILVNVPNKNNYMQVLQEQTRMLVNMLKEDECVEMKKILETLKLIKKKYQLKELKEIESLLQKKLINMKEEYKLVIQQISEGSLTKAADIFNKYKHMLKMLSQYQQQKSESKNQLINIIPQYIATEISKMNIHQQPIRITMTNCKKWNSLQQKLDKIKANYQIMMLHNENSQLEKSMDTFKQQLSTIVTISSQSINKMIQDLKQGANNEYTVDSLYSKIQEFQLLKQINSLKQTVEIKIEQRTEKMQMYLNVQKSILNQIQEAIEDKSNKSKLKALLKNLETALAGIEKLSRFESQEIRSKGATLIKTVMQSLVRYLEENQSELETISINFRANDQIIHNQLDKITKIMSEIQIFANASKRLPELTIKQIQQSGSQIIKKVIQQLNNQIQELIRKSESKEIPYSNMNLKITDKGIYFLKIAGNQLRDFMKKQINQVRQKYKGELQKFKSYIYNEILDTIKNLVGKIKQINTGYQNEVRKVKKRIDLLNQIMVHHQNIKQFVFQDIEVVYNSIKESIQQLYQHHKLRWETVKKSPIINDKIILNERCRILSLFDKIFNEIEFSKLSKEIILNIQKMNLSVHANIKSCLDTKNFTLLKRQLQNLHLNKDTSEGQIAMNQALVLIQSTVKIIANQINTNLRKNKFSKIQNGFDFDYFEQLEKLSIIKTSISKFISEQSNIICIINDTNKNLSEIIKSSFENCAIQVQELIQEQKLPEAQEKCRELKRNQQIINSSLQQPIKRQFKFVYQKQERYKRWKLENKQRKIRINASKLISQELQIQIMERFDDFKLKYSNLKDDQKIDDKFKIHYSRILEGFDEKRLKGTYKQLKYKIDQILTKRLEHKIQIIKNQANLVTEKKLINQFNFELQKIPKGFKDQFSKILESYLEIKKKQKKQKQAELSRIFENKDNLKIDQIYDQYTEADQNNDELLKGLIKSKISVIIQKLIDQIEKQNKQVFQIYQIFKQRVYPFYNYKEKNYFADLISKNYIKQFINLIEKNLKKFRKLNKDIEFDKNISGETNQLQVDNISVNISISQEVLSYIDMMFNIYTYVKSNNQVQLIKDCFLNQFKTCINYYCQKYFKSINFLKEKWNALENQVNVVQDFNQHFMILDRISDSVNKILDYFSKIVDNKKYQFEQEFKTIKVDIEKVEKFKCLKEKFIEKFQQNEKQILKFQIDDKLVDTNDVQRDSILKMISNKLKFIKNYEFIYGVAKKEKRKGQKRFNICEQNFKKNFLLIYKFNNQVIDYLSQAIKIQEARLQKFNINHNIIIIYQNNFPHLIVAGQDSQRNNENVKKKLNKIIVDHRNKGQSIINMLVTEIEKNKTQLLKISNKKSTQLRQEIGKISVQYKKKLDEKTKYFQERIKNENDKKEKQNLKIHRDSDVIGIKNEEKEEIKKIQDIIKDQEQKQQERIQRTVNQLRISLAQLLIKLKILSIHIFSYQKIFKQQSQHILEVYEKKCGQKSFRLLALAIDSLKNMYGARMLQQQSKFNGFKLQKFKRKMENVGIKQVIEQLKSYKVQQKIKQKQEKQKLTKKYQEYLQIYQKSLNDYTRKTTQQTISNLIQKIKTLSNQVKEDLKKMKSHSGHELIADIFALWTILKADVTEEGVVYLYQPHPAQIVAIFCILGMAQKGTLKNRFAEVLTGEGKSIILAGLVSYLACVGYQVNCVCYSKYLSDRDQKLFKQLFQKLSINDYIKYGTFNEICQDLFNSQSIKLRANVQKVLLEPQNNKLKGLFSKFIKNDTNIFASGSIREKILVIDEVDVFFSEDFYGNLYLPYIGVKKQIIQKLINFIWTNRQNPELYAQTLVSQQYIKSISQFPSLKDLIFQAVKGMIRSVKNWKHQYIVLDNKIAYKQQDGISFKTNYGYNTIFAYFYQCQRGNITIPIRQEATEIGLTIGEFSYSRLPKYFKYIMGVTGTLKILSDVKKKICVEEYQIKQHFYIPSVYGKSRREHKGIKIIPENLHRQQIVNEVKSILDKQRSVLIFFETAKQANEFQISKQFESLRSKSVVLTQQHDDDTKTYRINRATVPGNITIMTKSFGRGTDFVIYSQQLRNRGGLHVIQTFLSEQQSEQIQIMGRVARQGDLGSYTLKLNSNDLQRINLNIEIQNGKVAIKQNKQIGNLDDFKILKQIINKKRNEAYNQKYQVSISNARKYDTNHQKSMEMMKNLISEQYKQVFQYIKSLNSFPEIFKAKPIKTILALDATGSMSSVLSKTASIIGIAFQNAQKIIKIEKPEATFELQIAIYRNYNCRAEELFSYTPFECKPQKISKFLKDVKATGGWGNQALEILYEHVNKLTEVDQIIIIGDAPANSYSETQSKRNQSYGQKYWKSTQYPQPLNAEVEFKKINQRNIKIHTFYIGSYPKRYFQSISSQTNGSCQQLVPSSPSAENELTDFIAKNILDKIGGKALLEAYQNIIVRARHK